MRSRPRFTMISSGWPSRSPPPHRRRSPPCRWFTRGALDPSLPDLCEIHHSRPHPHPARFVVSPRKGSHPQVAKLCATPKLTTALRRDSWGRLAIGGGKFAGFSRAGEVGAGERATCREGGARLGERLLRRLGRGSGSFFGPAGREWPGAFNRDVDSDRVVNWPFGRRGVERVGNYRARAPYGRPCRRVGCASRRPRPLGGNARTWATWARHQLFERLHNCAPPSSSSSAKQAAARERLPAASRPTSMLIGLHPGAHPFFLRPPEPTCSGAPRPGPKGDSFTRASLSTMTNASCLARVMALYASRRLRSSLPDT